MQMRPTAAGRSIATHAAGVRGGHAPGADEAREVPSALAVPVREHLEHLRDHERQHGRDAGPVQQQQQQACMRLVTLPHVSAVEHGVLEMCIKRSCTPKDTPHLCSAHPLWMRPLKPPEGAKNPPGLSGSASAMKSSATLCTSMP